MARSESNVGTERTKLQASRPPHVQAKRDLGWSAVITAALSALLIASVFLWGGSWAPKLGLDLEGGTQMILQPQVNEGQTVNAEQLTQAVDIMRARVDGQGVAEAEVSTLGSNVVVSIPGQMTKQQEDSLRASSQMAFRPVLAMLPVEQPAPEGEPAPEQAPDAPATPATPTTPAPASPPASPTASPTASPAASGPAPTGASGGGMQAPLTPPAPSPAPSPAPDATEEGEAPTGLPTAEDDGTPRISDEVLADPNQLVQAATSEQWMTPELQMEALSFDCAAGATTARPDPRKATVACSTDGTAKFILGPTVMDGNHIADAGSGMATNPQTGQATGGYEVTLKTRDDYVQAYATISGYMVNLEQPRNQLAAVLDNRVISAPYFSSAITGGQASITGDFTAEEAKLLADQLKFGALPMSFSVQSTENVSPTVGGDQLRNGLWAGLAGLALVFLYFLWQYRALGLVTVASVLFVGVLTYLCLALFGWGYNLRLTMAGVTGAIVAIGTTADSFIVYFERVRDEMREGKRLEAAVQAGWARARRTILVSDGVNLIAALVLYFLAAANVRGFAFMLILTTLLDLLVTFLFTHPLLTLLARTKFFGRGHKWSGFDPSTLGRAAYRGAGQFTIADRKAAAAGAAASGAAPQGGTA